MIVVEGPDGSGKTTLIQRLVKDLKLELMPRVVSKQAQAMVDLDRWVEQDLAKGFGPRIYDRHRLISEPIYGPLLRRHLETKFKSLPWLYAMMRQFYELRPILIYCLPPFEAVTKNLENDPDNEVVWGKESQVYWLYHAQAARDFDRSIRWDYTREDAEVEYAYLLLKIHEELKRTGHARTA